jgi:hypothetical protein
MTTKETALTYLDCLNAATSEAERRSVAAEFHAYYVTLEPTEQAEAKAIFKPALDELKMRVAEIENEVEALFTKRLQTQA